VVSERNGHAELGEFSRDCFSALSDLGQKPEAIPAEIRRMATEVSAEPWIGQVQFQSIPLNDWRVRETLTRLKARGGNKSVNYAWKIFRDLPERQPQPKAETNGHAANGHAPKKSSSLIGAEAGLMMARRALAKGETDQAEVDEYEAKVERLKREAGIT
jgi:hypothetical protein